MGRARIDQELCLKSSSGGLDGGTSTVGLLLTVPYIACCMLQEEPLENTI